MIIENEKYLFEMQGSFFVIKDEGENIKKCIAFCQRNQYFAIKKLSSSQIKLCCNSKINKNTFFLRHVFLLKFINKHSTKSIINFVLGIFQHNPSFYDDYIIENCFRCRCNCDNEFNIRRLNELVNNLMCFHKHLHAKSYFISVALMMIKIANNHYGA